MEYRYNPQGVCSYEMIFEIEDNIIKNVEILGGCKGNSQGISRLLVGMNINEVINRLKGVQCGIRGTSCPDQIAKALEEYKNNRG